MTTPKPLAAARFLTNDLTEQFTLTGSELVAGDWRIMVTHQRYGTKDVQHRALQETPRTGLK